MKFTSLIICFILCFGLRAWSVNTSTAIFDPKFRTLQFSKNGDVLEDAVLVLNSNNILTLSFDELTDDPSYLRARLLHCNSNWQPSLLVESEYVDGFNMTQIEDFGFSKNTYIHYINYLLTIGEEGFRPLVSGNYVVQIYDEDDPDSSLLQARFRVTEQAINILGKADGRTDKGFNDEFQQLSLQLSARERLNYNPYTDLAVEVIRNGRPDTSVMVPHPQRVEGEKIIYEHKPELIFPAGNEYRRFETVRTDYPGMRVDSVRFISPMHQAYITLDDSRAEKDYIYDRTQQGKYKIDEYNATDPDLGSDYVTVHFSLEYPEIPEGDIYVEGDLSLRGYTRFNRMQYDREKGLYNLAMPLKQGSYNYQYVVMPKNYEPVDELTIIGGYSKDETCRGTEANTSMIEGDKYETLNEYDVYVYLKQPGTRYDRLLGAGKIIANKN